MLILHVDNHSDKIVNKMREAQFKKTLKGTNGDKDFPEDMLSRIYYSVSTTEIKIYEEYFDGPVTPLRWRVNFFFFLFLFFSFFFFWVRPAHRCYFLLLLVLALILL